MTLMTAQVVLQLLPQDQETRVRAGRAERDQTYGQAAVSTPGGHGHYSPKHPNHPNSNRLETPGEVYYNPCDNA